MTSQQALDHITAILSQVNSYNLQTAMHTVKALEVLQSVVRNEQEQQDTNKLLPPKL